MRARLAHLLALAAIAAGPAGCGAGSGPPRPDGKALFAQDCQACHSLTGVQSPKRQGGDLLGEHLSRSVMIQFTREMPVRHRLDEAQVRAVSDYVIAVERRGR